MGGKKAKRKGYMGEMEILEAYLEKLGREKSIRNKRNFQGGYGGGQGNGDFKAEGFERFHFEMKNQKTLLIPDWWRQTLYDAKKGHCTAPVLHFKMPIELRKTKAKKYYVILTDLQDYFVTWLENLGYDIQPSKKKKLSFTDHTGKNICAPAWINKEEKDFLIKMTIDDKPVWMFDFDFVEEVSVRVAEAFGWTLTPKGE